MLKILIRIAIPLCVLWIAFFRFANNLYNILVVLFLVLLGLLYYVTEDVVTDKMIKKATGEKEFFSIKAGYIADKKATAFVKGRLVITSSEVRFYKRAKDRGGCSLLYSVTVPEIASYSMGKVDEYHNGIVFNLNSGLEVLFSSNEVAKKEEDVKKALGWE